jgi:hypothetical protein
MMPWNGWMELNANSRTVALGREARADVSECDSPLGVLDQGQVVPHSRSFIGSAPRGALRVLHTQVGKREEASDKTRQSERSHRQESELHLIGYLSKLRGPLT